MQRRARIHLLVFVVMHGGEGRRPRKTLGRMHPGQATEYGRLGFLMAIPILMYHNIAKVTKQVRHLRGLYVTPTAFARQMWLLHRLGYCCLSMSAAMPYLRGERSGKVMVVTLDDGYLDNLQAALPVLQAHGFSATCYLVSGSLARFNTWDAERLKVCKPLMSPAQVRQWHDAGMEVGAHTRSHPHLSGCTAAQLHEEIAGCRDDLEQCIGAPVTQFCYPYGDVTPPVIDAVCDAGYAAATTTRRGRVFPGQHLWTLPRVPVSYRHILPQFALRTLTGYEDRRG
ncbi:polysaccharide deacetylase [Xylella fastidiosa]|nr:polysaccharide deacetylase [Xylella fastidiosa]